MNLQVMAATLVVLALVLFLLAARSRNKTGIPAGEVFYQDLPGQPFFGQPLRSNALGISGKPDCLVRTVDGTVPVELKNSSKPPARGEVYANHMIQALAYCALVEDRMKVRVPYALVIYAGQQVRKVLFTDERREWLLQTIRELEVARAHDGESKPPAPWPLCGLWSPRELRSGAALRARCALLRMCPRITTRLSLDPMPLGLHSCSSVGQFGLIRRIGVQVDHQGESCC